jgi:hypothetical protein
MLSNLIQFFNKNGENKEQLVSYIFLLGCKDLQYSMLSNFICTTQAYGILLEATTEPQNYVQFLSNNRVSFR